MGKKTIRFEFLADGTMQAETDGFEGPACEKTLKRILEGTVKVQDIEHKAEYYDEEEKILIDTGAEGGW